MYVSISFISFEQSIHSFDAMVWPSTPKRHFFATVLCMCLLILAAFSLGRYQPLPHRALLLLLQLPLSAAMSFVKNLLAPGGGVALIPFIRYTIGCLLLVCMAAFVSGVARIHMAILSFLSGGLLISLSFFQSEYEKMQRNRGGGVGVSASSGAAKPAAGKKERAD